MSARWHRSDARDATSPLGCPLLAARIQELPLGFATHVDAPTPDRPTFLPDDRPRQLYRNADSGSDVRLLPVAQFLADRSSDRWYGGAPMRVGEDEVSPSIASYTPAAVKPELWERIAPTARAWSAMVPAESGRQAVQRLKPLAQYLAWRDQAGMVIDDPTEVFHPSDVDRFVHHGCRHLSDATRASYRSALRTVGEHVAGTELACPERTVSISKPRPQAPYGPAELAALLGAISGLPTAAARHNAMALVTYGRGAGLRASEIASLVGTDHEITPDGTVLVHIPGPGARSVARPEDMGRRGDPHLGAGRHAASVPGGQDPHRSSGHRGVLRTPALP